LKAERARRLAEVHRGLLYANTKPVNDSASVSDSFSIGQEPAPACGCGHWRRQRGQQRRSDRGNSVDEASRGRSGQRRRKTDRHGQTCASSYDYCRSLDIPVIEHAEDVSLRRAVMREGVTSTRLGLAGMPAARNLYASPVTSSLRAYRGAVAHAHLSAKGSLDQVRSAKQRGCASLAKLRRITHAD